MAGWWYGVVGHLESCDGNENYCRCHSSGELMPFSFQMNVIIIHLFFFLAIVSIIHLVHVLFVHSSGPSTVFWVRLSSRSMRGYDLRIG